jgi:hypothetical protein
MRGKTVGLREIRRNSNKLHLDRERPLSRADCLRTQSTGKCATCGGEANPTHSPTRLIRGVFCGACCPACHPEVMKASNYGTAA